MQIRYLKNFSSISDTEQTLLWTKTVSVIGCGGLGEYVALQLCRVGIGNINIVDYDVFDESNLNRQLFSHTHNLGSPKVVDTASILQMINPDIHLKAIQERFTADNANDLLAKSDLVIDALDNIPDRLILEKTCRELNIPLISAAIGGWYGHLTVIMPGDDTLSKLYTDPTQKGIESQLGNPAFTPALLASLQVSEAVKYLIGKPNLSRGKILYIDLLNLTFEQIEM